MAKNSRRQQTTGTTQQSLRPVTKAVRGILGLSASALVMSMSMGPGRAEAALPGFCSYGSGVNLTVVCNNFDINTSFPDLGLTDLTLVIGAADPVDDPSTIMPPPGNYGIDASWAGSITLVTHASIETDDADAIIGSAAGSGALSITNRGDVYAYYGSAINASSNDGDLTVVNSGYVDSRRDWGDGWMGTIEAYSQTGDISITNEASGSIHSSMSFDEWGLSTTAGIRAQSYDGKYITIDNQGEIVAGTMDGYGAYGIEVRDVGEWHPEVTVTNSGVITATNFNGHYAVGVYIDDAWYADVTNTVDGQILAGAGNGDAYGIEIYAYSDITINNAGYVAVEGHDKAVAIKANSDLGHVDITNSGEVRAYAQFDHATGIYAAAWDDASSVDSSGSVYARSLWDGATGISAEGDYGVDVTNSGTIDVEAYFDAYGIFATTDGGPGDVTVTNTVDGIITARSVGDDEDDAIGIYAVANGGDVTITNDGSIEAHSNSRDGNGIEVDADGGMLTVGNTGEIDASGDYYVNGIWVNGGHDAADISVTNSATGDINAFASNGIAWGIDTYTHVPSSVLIKAPDSDLSGDITIHNAGTITVTSDSGNAYGINAWAAGDIADFGSDTIDGYYYDYGFVENAGGDVTIHNTGTVEVEASDQAYGLSAYAEGGHVTITNDGSVAVSAGNDAYGIAVDVNDTWTDYGGRTYYVDGTPYTDDYGSHINSYGSVLIDNNEGASVTAHAEDFAMGIGVYTERGAVEINNAGDVEASSVWDNASGVLVRSQGGGVTIDNTGTITASTVSFVEGEGFYAGDDAIGIDVHVYGSVGQLNGDVSVSNAGTITATSYLYIEEVGSAEAGDATGIHVDNRIGSTTIYNAGTITADAYYNGIGIEVYANGAEGSTLSVTNVGDITATSHTWDEGSDYWAAGIDAWSNSNDVTVDNQGSITASAYYYATGINASSQMNVSVSNSGDVTASSDDADAVGIDAWTSGGQTDVENTGSVSVTAAGDATGVSAGASWYGGDVYVGNLNALDAETGAVLATGSIEATSQYGWAEGIAATGHNGAAVTVRNDGEIVVTSNADSYGTGSGSTITDWYASGAVGINAKAWDGGEYIGSVDVTNAGTITANSTYGAWGVYAMANEGHVTVTNEGDITVFGSSPDPEVYIASYGIDAETFSGDIHVDNAGGTIYVNSLEDAYGVLAVTDYGNIEFDNSGGLTVVAYEDAYGVYADANHEGGTGDTTVSNWAEGSIDVTAQTQNATGIGAYAYEGAVTVTNEGSITATAGRNAYGVAAYAEYGYVAVYNHGSIEASGGYDAVGIQAGSDGSNQVADPEDPYTYYSVRVVNTGDISVDAPDMAMGIKAYNHEDGDVLVVNRPDEEGNGGTISAFTEYGAAVGIAAQTSAGDIVIENSGAIYASSTGKYIAAGIGAYSGDTFELDGNTYARSGDVFVYNEGEIHADSSGIALGILASVTGSGSVYVYNDGLVQADGDVMSIGLLAANKYDSTEYAADVGSGSVDIVNTGDIVAVTNFTGESMTLAAAVSVSPWFRPMSAMGVMGASSYGDVSFDNAEGATVTATGTSVATAGAVGVALSAYGNVDAWNEGSVRATATSTAADGGEYGAMAIGMIASSYYGDVAVRNVGTISATASGGAYSTAMAVMVSGDYSAYVYNDGTIRASGDTYSFAIMSEGLSDDVIVNSGTITGAIVTGYGSDSLTNTGTWNALQYSDFGSHDDHVYNAPTGLIVMTDSTISMGDWSVPAGGGGGGVQAIEGEGNTFVNEGTIVVHGDSVIDMGVDNPNAFTNNGTITFADTTPAPDDTLTVYGDLAGDGNLIVDMNGDSGNTDALIVEGNVVPGTVMHVSGHIDHMPTSGETQIDVLRVTGDSATGQLAVGTITTDPDSFVTFGFTTGETLSAANTADDLHWLSIQVTGLSARGDALSTLAPAMQNYWHDSVGSLTRRTGVAENQELGVPTAWVRVQRSEETVKPDTGGRNFGAGGASQFDQTNNGMEFGVDVRVADSLRIGLMASKGDATVKIKGTGNAKINADSYGAYVTWLSENGFYVDATYRKMDFSTDVKAEGYKDKPDASADGYSLETGYAWKLESGLVLKPEVQYSVMSINKFDHVDNSYGTFDLKDGDSSRLRAGLTVQKLFGEKGKTWTPYGGAYYVNEMDGKGTFQINSDFRGNVDIGGNSLLLEGGITGQVGKWVLSGGLNWQDGGAISSAVGGQLSVRYSF